MANDDRQSEQFIREVDEELRREQLKSLWERFGLYIIAACVAVVVITGGYRGWMWWQTKAAAERGDRYIAASTQITDGNASGGSDLLRELQAEGGSYAMLARLRLAGLEASEGNRSGAIEEFDAIAADSSVDPIMRDLALIRASFLLLDEGDTAAAVERVQGLSGTGSPWRHAAREVEATAALIDGNLEQARELLLSIEQDAVAPQDARQRAALLLSLVDSRLPTTSTSGGESGDASTGSDNGSANGG